MKRAGRRDRSAMNLEEISEISAAGSLGMIYRNWLLLLVSL